MPFGEGYMIVGPRGAMRDASTRKRRAPRKKATTRRPRTKRTIRRSAYTPGGVSPFPNTMVCKMSYRLQNVTHNCGANGIPAVHYCRGNSLFDPGGDYSVSKPFYFNQLAAIYGRYRVIGAKITVYPTTLSPQGDARKILLQVHSHAIRGDNMNFVDVSDIMNMPRSKTMAWNRDSLGGKRTPSLSLYSNTNTVLANFNPQDDKLSSVPTGNPDNMWYFNIWMSNMEAAAATPCKVSIKIVYDVQWSRRTDIDIS